MQHLTLEEVARLVDEAPEPAEAEHLRSCLVCRRELEELRRVTSELADLPDPEPAPDPAPETSEAPAPPVQTP